MSKNTKSPAKLMMIAFIKATRDTPDFTFHVFGNEELARNFVHRMRVELSRMREQVIQRKQVPREFKVLLKSCTYNKDANKTEIVLSKSVGTHVEIADDMKEIFQDINGGEGFSV